MSENAVEEFLEETKNQFLKNMTHELKHDKTKNLFENIYENEIFVP